MLKAYYEKNFYRDETHNIPLWCRVVLKEESEARFKTVPVDTFEDLLNLTEDMNFWNHTIHRTKKGFFKRKTIVAFDFESRDYIDERNFTQGEFVRCYVGVRISMEDLMKQPADLAIQYMKERGLTADCLNYMKG